MALTPDNQAKRTTAKKAPAKATTKKAPAKTRSRPGQPAPSHEAIAKRAHELYEAQGGDDDVAHWLQAARPVVALTGGDPDRRSARRGTAGTSHAGMLRDWLRVAALTDGDLLAC